MLSAIILGACAKATIQPVVAMINPGDKIGDFLITTGDEESVTYMCTRHCPYDESTKTESCELTVGTKVNVGPGFYDDGPSSGKSLDEDWSEHTYEMIIEGHPVNLQAFGSIDIGHPMVDKIRNWNVVIVTDKPGKITARSTGVYGGDPIEYTAVLTFNTP